MPPRTTTAALAGFLVALTAATAPADAVSDKQKVIAASNLKEAGVTKSAVAESESLIVCGTLPETRLKTVATALQKTYKLARKGLQYEEKDEPWKGKLTVYFLPDRKDYGQFLRTVSGGKPDVPSYTVVRGDEPYVVSGAELPAKATDADVTTELSPLVAGALLAAKAGTASTAPSWVRTGFGRAAALRAGGTANQRFTTYKAQARTAVLGGGKPPPSLDDLWAAERTDAALLATAFMDFVAFGPGAVNFPSFLSAFRADENGNEPNMAAVLEAAKWKKDALEAEWRTWVQKGMIVK